MSQSSSREHLLEEVACVDADGGEVHVIHYRYVDVRNTPRGERTHLGAQGWRTLCGEPVKLIDRDHYEVISTGTLLIRSARCD